MDQHSGRSESDFQATDTEKQFRYKSGISGKLAFERVNEVTWKLTDGTMTNVPASHGQWGGYRTSWVINVAPNAWLARCGDQTSNPIPLTAAKSGAMAMAKGADGAYRIRLCRPPQRSRRTLVRCGSRHV